MKSISLLIAIIIFTNVAFTSLVEQKLKVKLEIPLSSSDLAGTSKEVELTLAIQIDDPSESSTPDASNQGNNGENGVPSSKYPNEVDPAKSTNINNNVPIDQTASSPNENSSESTHSFTINQENSFLECAVDYFTKTKEPMYATIYSHDLYTKYKTGEKSLDSEDYTRCVHFLTETETTSSP